MEKKKEYTRKELYELSKPIQPERSKREDLIEMIVPPQPDSITKMRLEQDLKFIKSVGGINSDLLGCGTLNSVEI